MKKIILVLMMLLMLPIVSFGDCVDPANSTYKSGDMELYFHDGYSGDKILNIIVGDNIYYYNYKFDKETCSIMLDTDPIIYLNINDMYLDLSYTPRFVFQTEFSTDGE